MISFILNNQDIITDSPSGVSLLDFIRNEMNLYGTKAGCREGDCGACTVLEGTLNNGKVSYKNIVSCLTPMINVIGKHIVTIEGIDNKMLSPVQQAIADHSATQCGFCTPGFVMSFTCHALSAEVSTKERAIAAISGNICRCTGYKSLEKAGSAISDLLKEKDNDNPVGWLVSNNFLPEYFLSIPERLSAIDNDIKVSSGGRPAIAGGTDLMVQKADDLYELNISSFYDDHHLKGIKTENGACTIGSATTTDELERSDVINELIPRIGEYMKLIAASTVRNMGTIGGNIVNASPIGDLTIIFLALNSDLIIDGKEGRKTIPLKDFYTGYKTMRLRENEIVRSISFPVNYENTLFNFEKVSKRKHLDIASVNSAISLTLENKIIKDCHLSAGGVSPVPLFLKKTSYFLKGKIVTNVTIREANRIMQEEISPISDVRGSKEYKRLLLRQLLYAHFIKIVPEGLDLKDLIISEN